MLLYETTSTDEDDDGSDVSQGVCSSGAKKVGDSPHRGSVQGEELISETQSVSMPKPTEPSSESKYEDYVKRQDVRGEEDDEEEGGSSTILYRMVPPVILPGIDLSPFFPADDLAQVKPGQTLQITDKGLYSITRPADVVWTNALIQRVFHDRFPQQKMKEYSMVDGTAGIGGNTISFASLFREVHAVEYNDVHYEVLRNNVICALGLPNVRTYHENILQWTDQHYIYDTHRTLFFIDPPWGGRKYKLFKYFTLRLGRVFIQDFIQKLYHLGYPMVVLKAPLNLNVNVILHEVGYTQVAIERGQHMMLLIFS